MERTLTVVKGGDTSDEHGRVCGAARALMQTVLDNEALAGQADFFWGHVMDCEHCAKTYAKEKAFLEVFRTRMPKKSCPKNIVEGIRSKIRIAKLKE